MHLSPFPLSSSTTLSLPFTPSVDCQAEIHAAIDVFALAQTLLSLATSPSTLSSTLNIHQRLSSIEEAVQSLKDQTTRAFRDLDAKVDRLISAAEVKVVPLGPIAETLDRQSRQCTDELAEFRIQLAEVVSDTKELMNAIEEAGSGASIEISELRGSVLGLVCSDDETASSLSVDTPPASSITELLPYPISTPAGYSVRKPLPKANLMGEVEEDRPDSPRPSRRSSALFAMDPVPRSDLLVEIPVGSYATKIKVKEGESVESARKAPGF